MLSRESGSSVGTVWWKPALCICDLAARLNSLLKNALVLCGTIPQRLKPRSYLSHLPAQINLCPFKILPPRIFSASREVVLFKAALESRLSETRNRALSQCTIQNELGNQRLKKADRFMSSHSSGETHHRKGRESAM